MTNLKPMKFKTFTWPNNPSSFEISFSKKLIIHDYPDFNGSESEDLGTSAKILTGSGVFFGKNAYSNFNKLSVLFKSNAIGNLYHPKFGTFKARFTKLTSSEEPTPNYVSYTIEFTEYTEMSVITKIVHSGSGSGSGSKSTKNRTYIVKNGDNLWNISKKYYGTGSKWRTIANANKKIIKNPNKIYPGLKLLIP